MTSPDLTNGRRGGMPVVTRFDDRLATVLAHPRDTDAARVAAWRHVVDLLGQPGTLFGDRDIDAAYDLLRATRAGVPDEIRAAAARSIAGRYLPASLIAFFADDRPTVAAPLLAKARLSDREWFALLPTFSPVARSLLRHRDDLSPGMVRALGYLGAHDLVLAAPAPDVDPVADVPETAANGTESEAAAATGGPVRIGAPMARIDPSRRGNPAAPWPVAADAGYSQAAPAWATGFRFETGADGVILWVEDAPRGPVIGTTIAVAAEEFDHGVDGQVAGAFRQLVPFRAGRLSIGGAGPVAGAWRISGVPFFEAVDRRLLGYRGTARRPRPEEDAAPAAGASGLYGSALPPDSLRQLVHELRTPLNAIVGFAEMIERQLLGPAAREYRGHAADIGGHGRRLLATVEDLDVSARVETQRLTFDRGSADAALMLARLRPDFDRVAAGRGVVLHFAIAGIPTPVAADPAAVERMFGRLLAATIGLAVRDERIRIELDPAGGAAPHMAALRVTRPRLLAGRDESALLDLGYTPEGEWPDAPMLGLGFALRLVRNLAQAAGGVLEIEDDAFMLRLPIAGHGLLAGNAIR